MRRNTPSNKLIRGSRCPCPIGGSRRACGAGRASSRRAEQSSRHGQQAGGQAAVPVGRGRAWPGFETTRQANDQQPSAGGVEATAGPAGHAAVPVGGGRTRAGSETTHRATRQRPCTTGLEGAGGSGGPGRASRRRAKRTISNQAPAVWRPPQGLRGLAAVPVGGGRTRAGSETTRQANDQQPSTGGVEAAAGPAGPGRGAGGRRQGLAGLRDRSLRAAGSRVAISRAAGPDGARKTRGATSPARKSELLVVLRILVGLAAVGATEGANRSHLFGRQREGEDVEVLALALRVTGLGQGQGAELVVPAQDEA